MQNAKTPISKKTFTIRKEPAKPLNLSARGSTAQPPFASVLGRVTAKLRERPAKPEKFAFPCKQARRPSVVVSKIAPPMLLSAQALQSVRASEAKSALERNPLAPFLLVESAIRILQTPQRKVAKLALSALQPQTSLTDFARKTAPQPVPPARRLQTAETHFRPTATSNFKVAPNSAVWPAINPAKPVLQA